MKENYGNIESLKELGRKEKESFSTKQLLNEKFKNIDGENRLEVTRRMERFFEAVCCKDIGKK